MTQDTFQRRYHHYQTRDAADAQAQANAVNVEGIDGDRAIAVELPPLGWCLMLESAVKFLRQDGIIRVIP